MPITPAGKDKAADMDLIAALLLLTWATLRARQDVDETVLAQRWQELRDAYREHREG